MAWDKWIEEEGDVVDDITVIAVAVDEFAELEEWSRELVDFEREAEFSRNVASLSIYWCGSRITKFP